MDDSGSIGPGTAVYELHGLRIRSGRPLAALRHADGTFDVDVRWGVGATVPAVAPPGRPTATAVRGGVNVYLATCHGNHWTLRVPGLCDFVIGRGLRDVECRADPDADPAVVSLVMSGLVVSFLLGLAGRCVLHASAVELGGRATAFAGPSGAGKSTLAALLCSAGAALVTDDVLRVGMDPGPVCVGGSPHIRLRRNAEWVLEEFSAPPPSAVTIDDRLSLSPSPAAAGGAPVPLATVVIPHLSREARAVETRALSAAAAVVALASASRVVGWTDPEVLRAQFCETAGIAPELTVVQAVIPWAPASRAALVDDLLKLADGGAGTGD